jgi:hypothetical protein
LEHEYDPTQHVRHLSSVPAEEEIEDLRSALTEVDNRITEINKKLNVFKHGGMKLVLEDIREARDAAKEALLNDQVRSMEGIAHVRGQVRAYERLLSLESILLNHREQLVVTRGSIMEALDGPE